MVIHVYEDTKYSRHALVSNIAFFGCQPICLPDYLLVSNQLFQSVGLNKADAVHARHHCLSVLLGMAGCSRL